MPPPLPPPPLFLLLLLLLLGFQPATSLVAKLPGGLQEEIMIDNNRRTLSIPSSSLSSPHERTNIIDQFCADYHITPGQCQMLHNRVTARVTETTTENTANETAATETEIATDTSPSYPARINYAKTIPPSLPLFLPPPHSTAATIRRYQGETVAGAIVRFCGLYRLSEMDCEEVAGLFTDAVDEEERPGT